MIEPSIALFGESFEEASRVLEKLLEETGAQYTLLVDRKGFVLAHQEALWAPRPPALDSLATLVAGNAAATKALAELLGEKRFSEIVHQGEQQGIYVEEVNDLALLVIIFDQNAPVGRVKLYGKRAAGRLDHITQRAKVESGAAQNKFGLDTEYHESASALLDDLFGES